MHEETESDINESVRFLLKNICKEAGFATYALKISRGSSKCDGYTSIVSKVCITGEDHRGNYKTLNLIVKNASNGEGFRTALPIPQLYETEIHIYDKVFSAFKSLELARGLTPSNIGPLFYKGSAVCGDETLILENLKENGYVLHDNKSGMNEEHVALLMDKYARLHAASMVMKEKSRDKFDRLVAPLDDIIIDFLKGPFFDTLMYRCTKAVESLCNDSDREVIKLYKEFLNGIPSYLDELHKDVDEYSVVLHGDCWCNNMMFKYANPNDLSKPSEVRLIDFQVSKLGSPAIDLCHFFYPNSCKEVLNKRVYYMELYHKTLSSHILKLGGNPEKMFPYEVLQKHWKKYAKFGLIIAAIAVHVALSDADEKVDFATIAEEKGNIGDAFNYEIANVAEYNDRLRHIILHFYENQLF